MTRTEKVKIKQVLQIGVVVKDIQKAMERYWNIFGIGPWHIYTFQPPFVTNTTLRGKPALYSMKLALAQVENIQWELIQPLTGPSIFKEFLEQKGGGVHHVACDMGDYDQAMAALKKHGIDILMSGTTPSDAFAHMDTDDRISISAQITPSTATFKIPAPEAVYPPSA